jgi:hypothetical protein
MSMASPAFVYSACGLSLASDAPIPGLHPRDGDRQIDVTISMRGQRSFAHRDWPSGSAFYESSELDESGRPVFTISASDASYEIAFSDGATFLIDRTGARVIVHWPPPLDDADAASYLTGGVLAFVLRLRGSVPLHASAVAIDGGGRIFVGESWSGKSSIAAAFSLLGYPILSDDIVRTEVADGEVIAYPSHPRLNVWPDSATTLYGAPDALPVHSETYHKHYLDLLDAGYSFQSAPVPIDAVYVLRERVPGRQSPLVTAMPRRAALMALVGHTHGNRLLDRTMRARELDVLCALVERVPVRELQFGDDLGALVSSCRVLSEWPVEQNRPVQVDRPYKQ